MAVTVLLGDAMNVQFMASPLAELASALHVLDHPAKHPTDRLNHVRPLLPADHLARHRRFAVLWGAFRCRAFLPAGPGPPRGLQEEIAALVQADRLDLVASILHSVKGGGARPDAEHALTDREQQQRLLAHARARGPECEALIRDVFAQPEEVIWQLADFLTTCEELFFGELWAHLAPRVGREVADRRELLRLSGPAATLLQCLPNSSLDRAGHVTIDKLHVGRVDLRSQPLVLVPTLLGSPLLVVKDETANPAIQYPLSATDQRARTPLQTQLRRLAALSNPTVLQLCRDLAREPRSTMQLADRWSLDPAQVSRHLKSLVDAELVTVERSGRFVLYSLDLAAVEGIGHDLAGTLLT